MTDTLQTILDSTGDPVSWLRNQQVGPNVYPGVPAEFSNWRDEQRGWAETCVLFNQSYHMAELMVEGPGAFEFLNGLGINSFKGFAVTFRQMFKKPITQQYPDYKRPVYPRFRGRHRLWRHENGLEKCVGCSLCAAACPADCIRVVAAENTEENRVSPGERYARIYEINLSRCIFCGYCELACPFDAITLEAEYELSEYSRDDLIYTKDMLLAEPMKRMPVADRDLYDTPIPVWRAES